MSDYYFDDVTDLVDHLKYLYPHSSVIKLHSTLIIMFAYYYFNIDIEGMPKYLFKGDILTYNTGIEVKEVKKEHKKHYYSKSYGYEPKEYPFTDSELDTKVNDLINYTTKEIEQNFSDFELFVFVNDMALYLDNPEDYFNTDKPIPHDLLLDSIYRYLEDEDEEEE